MEETLYIIGFLVWYSLSLVVAEKVGKKRQIGEQWSFFFSFMFSPLIGLGLSLISKKK